MFVGRFWKALTVICGQLQGVWGASLAGHLGEWPQPREPAGKSDLGAWAARHQCAGTQGQERRV